MTTLRVNHSAAGSFDVATGWPVTAPRTAGTSPRTRTRELLDEVEDRTEAIAGSTRERMDALLDAVFAVSSGLDLDATLRQIVHAAMDLVDARCGALGGSPDRSFVLIARCRYRFGSSAWACALRR